jgi:hypothetical protein
MEAATYRIRYYRGVRYVAPNGAAPHWYARCGTCGRAWDDTRPTAITPTPSGRCPFEGFARHNGASLSPSTSQEVPRG